jgi:crossover junction endodeoxyribonuclease RuvC
MIVLGIDPGTAALGYGIIERTGGRLRSVDFGVISTSPDLPLGERLRAIHDGVIDLIELHAPALVGVERLFFSRNAQTAFAVGQARGVVVLAAAERSVALREATPNEVKMAVAGYGAADKGQVARMVAAILSLDAPPTPDDAADALAVAIFVANSERVGDRPGSPAAERAGVLDRAAAAPIVRGETPYERAVREALRREPAPTASPNRRGR